MDPAARWKYFKFFLETRLKSKCQCLTWIGHLEKLTRFFKRCFRDLIRVPRIRQNYHRVTRIREIRSLQVHSRVTNIFLKKTLS